MDNFDKIKVFELDGEKKGKGIFIHDGIEYEFLDYIINPNEEGSLPENGVYPRAHFEDVTTAANVYPSGYQGGIPSTPRFLNYVGVK